MPAIRSSKKRCAFDPISHPKPLKPRAPRKTLSAEEKENAKVEKEKRKESKEAKKAWEDKLKPWVENSDFRFPIGTMALYKSDAKSAYSLTEAEILTLPHESIPCSSKTFFSQEDARRLAERKFDAGAAKEGVGRGVTTGDVRLFEKTENDNRKRRANFRPKFAGYVDPSEYRSRRFGF